MMSTTILAFSSVWAAGLGYLVFGEVPAPAVLVVAIGTFGAK
jgi:hypothetical protein